MVAIYRQEVRLFTDQQVELLTNFAAQAVIAIENTRILNELRREIAAAADRHRRRAQGYQPIDLRSAGGARNIVQSAARLCEADTVFIGRPKGESFLLRSELWILPRIC